MCEFVSWIQLADGTIKYLTNEDLATPRGLELILFCGDREDLKGHGAIARYHRCEGVHKECTDFSSPDNFPSEIAQAIKDGRFGHIDVPKECTDFSSPDNFPSEIAQAIKDGRFGHIGVPEVPGQLLLTRALWPVKYNKARAKRDKARAEYDKAGAEYYEARVEYYKAEAEYYKKAGTEHYAEAEYNKARAEYDKTEAEYNKARAEYDKAGAEYNKARAEYDKAGAEYYEALAECFWGVFADPKNRKAVWR
jgi:hypothetical protein